MELQMMKRGYLQDPPVEGPPHGYAEGHIWQLATDQIVIKRWDEATAETNNITSNELFASPPYYYPPVSLELLGCPTCGATDNQIVTGRWDDPLTVHCPCGASQATPSDRPMCPENDWGRNLLKRLILTTADPSYEARRLLHEASEHRASERRLAEGPYSRRPRPEDMEIVSAVDRDTHDLGRALTDILQPKLPDPHAGWPLNLLLVQVARALLIDQVRNSADGRRLEAEVRGLLDDLRCQADRYPR
ncbi:hypothetical protein [Streptomyces sp. NPDC049555]|uniref:hypothetical protein n=1 Tax=Streptomyces sp. NPDC049555 TaxID=3154930 RepID=UPI0034242929